MSSADRRGVVFAAEILTGGVTGLVVGLFAFPVVATFSPLCLLPLTSGACDPLARGPFLLLEAMGISVWVALFGLVSALATVSVLSYYGAGNEAS